MYDKKGLITEATTSNIWIIKNKEIYTPPLKKNILAGVTRKKVFEISKILGIKSHEKEIKLEYLSKADAVFLTNSSSLMVMAKKIDNLKLRLDKDNIYNIIFNKFIEIINSYDK